jgi:hypothetical protein
VTGKKRGRCKQLLDDLQDKRGYWKLKEEKLDPSVENSLWDRLWTCSNTALMDEF